MEIYDYSKIGQCNVCGSIETTMEQFINTVKNMLQFKDEETLHPKEIERRERLMNKLSNSPMSVEQICGSPSPFINSLKKRTRGTSFLNNSVIIVSGSCGIGMKSDSYYLSLFEKFNKILHKNNCHVLLLRGNGDDKSYFYEEKINFSNIRTIKDYSIVKLKHFNCLCIGGATSIDRKWKMIQGERIGRKLYFEGEELIYDEDALDEIIKKYDVACVVTASSPSFVYPGTNSFRNSKWLTNDKELLKDLSNERAIMDKIYNKLIESDKKPYAWIYGRFNSVNKNSLNDIIFLSLLQTQMISFNEVVESNFGVDLSKKVTNNKSALDDFISKYIGGQQHMVINEEEGIIDGNELDDIHEEDLLHDPREIQVPPLEHEAFEAAVDNLMNNPF